MRSNEQNEFEDIVKKKDVARANSYIKYKLIPEIESISEQTGTKSLNLILSQYEALYNILSERSNDPRVANMMNKIISLDDARVMLNSFKSDLGSLSQTSPRKRPAETNNETSIEEEPENYLRFSTRKRFKILSSKEKKEKFLDFIKTDLDAPLYNQYMNSIKKKKFDKALEMIDDTMYQIKIISENPDFEFSMTPDQMRDYLLEPIREAADLGNEDAKSAMLLASKSETQIMDRNFISSFSSNAIPTSPIDAPQRVTSSSSSSNAPSSRINAPQRVTSSSSSSNAPSSRINVPQRVTSSSSSSNAPSSRIHAPQIVTSSSSSSNSSSSRMDVLQNELTTPNNNKAVISEIPSPQTVTFISLNSTPASKPEAPSLQDQALPTKATPEKLNFPSTYKNLIRRNTHGHGHTP